MFFSYLYVNIVLGFALDHIMSVSLLRCDHTAIEMWLLLLDVRDMFSLFNTVFLL